MEESRGPADLGEEEEEDLSDDQETVEDGPEDASRLVGNGRVPAGITRQQGRAPTTGRMIRTEHNRGSLPSSCVQRPGPICSGRSGRC